MGKRPSRAIPRLALQVTGNWMTRPESSWAHRGHHSCSTPTWATDRESLVLYYWLNRTSRWLHDVGGWGSQPGWLNPLHDRSRKVPCWASNHAGEAHIRTWSGDLVEQCWAGWVRIPVERRCLSVRCMPGLAHALRMRSEAILIMIAYNTNMHGVVKHALNHDLLEVELGDDPKQANSALPLKQNSNYDPFIPEGWQYLSISVFLMYVCQITSIFYFSISVFYFSISVFYFSILLQYFSILLQYFASVIRGQVHTYHK